jgi:hypothetical protein
MRGTVRTVHVNGVFSCRRTLFGPAKIMPAQIGLGKKLTIQGVSHNSRKCKMDVKKFKIGLIFNSLTIFVLRAQFHRGSAFFFFVLSEN